MVVLPLWLGGNKNVIIMVFLQVGDMSSKWIFTFFGIAIYTCLLWQIYSHIELYHDDHWFIVYTCIDIQNNYKVWGCSAICLSCVFLFKKILIYTAKIKHIWPFFNKCLLCKYFDAFLDLIIPHSMQMLIFGKYCNSFTVKWPNCV